MQGNNGFEKIFNEVPVLKFLEVRIDDFIIIPDDVITFEWKYDLFDFGVSGYGRIRDSFDMTNSGFVNINGTNKLTISMMDVLGDKTIKTYRITKFTSTRVNERFKNIDIEFQDEMTYKLKNTYISKSFNATPIDVLNTYITDLKLQDDLDLDKMTTDIVAGGTSQLMVVPQHINVIDFIKEKLSYDNIRIWFDRYKLYAKEIKPSELQVVKDPEGRDLEFSDNVSNNYYLFKIHDHDQKGNPIAELNQMAPIDATYRFDGNKTLQSQTKNLTDVSSTFAMNTMDMSGLQQTTGTRLSTQSMSEQGIQEYQLFDTFMKTNQIFIATYGTLKYANIGTVVNLTFKGEASNSVSPMEGDTLIRGKYIITAVVDKIFKGKFIQKISLGRLDATTPRKVK